MPVTVVVGGQYGSEGKGKVVAYLARKDNVAAVVRCGGPNAGHSFEWQGTKYSLRQIPSGLINPETRLYLAPGSIVNPAVLLEEIDRYKLERSRVRIDPCSAIVTDEEISAEKYLKLRERIGSTLSGTGATTAKKVLRHEGLRLARDVRELEDLLGDVALELNELLSQGKRVIVEGTQGFGLSLHHGGHYPYATSRDTSASGFLSEAGISPIHVDQIIMVIRTFPIRVGGDSGPLPNEISWEEVTKLSGYPLPVAEHGTVSGRLRRVAHFDIEQIRRAVVVNKPTSLALSGLDYLDHTNFTRTSQSELTPASREFLSRLEKELRVGIALIGTGPDLDHFVDCR